LLFLELDNSILELVYIPKFFIQNKSTKEFP